MKFVSKDYDRQAFVAKNFDFVPHEIGTHHMSVNLVVSELRSSKNILVFFAELLLCFETDLKTFSSVSKQEKPFWNYDQQ